MNEVLKAEKLNKHFYDPGDFHVLKDVSFSVNKGEFVALVGKSGSGKSTLLYLISTLDTAYDGSLIINNKKLTGLSQNALAKFRNENLGFVFQFHFLLPEFTALENVMLPALKLGRYKPEKIRAMAMEKLDRMDMAGFAKKTINKLSGGQQQRVAIVRALINDPIIIMADEPTGNLDSANTEIVFRIFQDLAKKNGNTIITVTHDIDFAKRADRIIEMVDGTII